MLFFFQAEDGIRDLVRSRGLGDVYKRQSTNLAELNFEFISASGKEQKIESKIQKGLIEFETSALVPGLYFLSVKHKDQKPSLYKVLIQ